MYDILQLNDMLVPELLDIADDLKIDNAKKMDKQELIYKILDRQAVQSSQVKSAAPEKGKRKRIVKASTANSTEEAVVEESAPELELKRPVKKALLPKKDEKIKKVRKKADEQPEESGEDEPDGDDNNININNNDTQNNNI